MTKRDIYSHIIAAAISAAAVITAIPAMASDTAAATVTDEVSTPASPAWAIDSAEVSRLCLNVDGTVYLRDNEFDSPMTRGYTLPGFRLMPTVSYTPTRQVRIEAGVYAAHFWGTDRYPNVAYSDIAYWTGEEHTARGMHIVPVLRAQINPTPNIAIVLGTIYGGLNHNLLEPLYAPELALTADPETGAQIIYSGSRIDADVWVNWESFIYRGDTHQEAFTFGVSSRFKYNDPASHIHLYSPIQAVFQHRGGEIDTLVSNSVQTLFNGALGVGARIDLRHRLLRSLTIEADALAYNQQVGTILPHERGWAYCLHASLDIGKVRARAGYLHGDRFISLMGYPFFGTHTLTPQQQDTRNVSVLWGGVKYCHEFAAGYSLGFEAEVYRHFRTTQAEMPHLSVDPSLSYAAALYIRINPSFLLKQLK